ncbi:TPA: hypothetical protein ACH3X3_010948 [Trebouxia sp. C0006]
MQHDAGMICITAVLDLLLAVASPLMDPSTDVHQIMCAGLPALLRCVASPSTGGWVAQELLGLMLDRLATDSSLNLLPAAVKLEGAVQAIVKAVSTKQHNQELGHLQMEAIYAIFSVESTWACFGNTASKEFYAALSDLVLGAASTCLPVSTLQHCAACMGVIADCRNFAKRQVRGQALPSWVLLKRMATLLEDFSLGIEACLRSVKVAGRAACDTLLKVFIMTAATYDLSSILCEYDTKKSLQAIFANHCGTQFLVDNLVKTISACKDAPKKSSPASSKLRPHHEIGLEKATQPAFQTALVECIMKTVLSSASPAKDVVYFVQHGLTPMFTRFTTALAKAIAHFAASPDHDLEQAEHEVSEVKTL